MWKCQPVSSSSHKSKGCPPYTQKNSAYFSLCSSFHLWCLYLNGERCIKKSVLKMDSRQESAWASVCFVCVMSAPARNCTSAQEEDEGRGRPPLPPSECFLHRDRERKESSNSRKSWANSESLSPLYPCKAFQFACLLLCLSSSHHATTVTRCVNQLV